jgi:ribonuclease HI
VASVGGIILDPGGNTLFQFAWGLGVKTNNIVEAYSLYLGLKIARDHQIHKLTVIGDSMIIIRVVINNHSLENNLLRGIILRIKFIAQEFEEFNFYHVKRTLNSQADTMAKIASREMQGEILLNDERGTLPIP